jgi:hypothetical protein
MGVVRNEVYRLRNIVTGSCIEATHICDNPKVGV